MIKVSIQLDSMGCLHIFKGHNRKLTQVAKYLYNDNKGNEADLYFQFEEDIEAIKSILTFEQISLLEGGWQINAKIHSEYFNEKRNH